MIKIIHGAEYEFTEACPEEGEGPSWGPVEANRALPFICGECDGEEFKIVPGHWSQYETWAFCECGNKFVVHSG